MILDRTRLEKSEKGGTTSYRYKCGYNPETDSYAGEVYMIIKGWGEDREIRVGEVIIPEGAPSRLQQGAEPKVGDRVRITLESAEEALGATGVITERVDSGVMSLPEDLRILWRVEYDDGEGRGAWHKKDFEIIDIEEPEEKAEDSPEEQPTEPYDGEVLETRDPIEAWEKFEELVDECEKRGKTQGDDPQPPPPEEQMVPMMAFRKGGRGALVAVFGVKLDGAQLPMGEFDTTLVEPLEGGDYYEIDFAQDDALPDQLQIKFKLVNTKGEVERENGDPNEIVYFAMPESAEPPPPPPPDDHEPHEPPEPPTPQVGDIVVNKAGDKYGLIVDIKDGRATMTELSREEAERMVREGGAQIIRQEGGEVEGMGGFWDTDLDDLTVLRPPPEDPPEEIMYLMFVVPSSAGELWMADDKTGANPRKIGDVTTTAPATGDAMIANVDITWDGAQMVAGVTLIEQTHLDAGGKKAYAITQDDDGPPPDEQKVQYAMFVVPNSDGELWEADDTDGTNARRLVGITTNATEIGEMLNRNVDIMAQGTPIAEDVTLFEAPSLDSGGMKAYLIIGDDEGKPDKEPPIMYFLFQKNANTGIAYQAKRDGSEREQIGAVTVNVDGIGTEVRIDNVRVDIVPTQGAPDTFEDVTIMRVPSLDDKEADTFAYAMVEEREAEPDTGKMDYTDIVRRIADATGDTRANVSGMMRSPEMLEEYLTQNDWKKIRDEIGAGTMSAYAFSQEAVKYK